MAKYLKVLDQNLIQEIENVNFTNNRMPPAGSFYLVKTKCGVDKGKPSIISDLSFGTHPSSWKTFVPKIVKGYAFGEHQIIDCLGVGYCTTCNQTPVEGDVYTKKYTYCRKQDSTGKQCNSMLQKLQEKCPHKVRWYKTKPDEEGNMMNLVLFQNNHIHNYVITGKFTKKAEEHVDKHVKINPNIKPSQLKKRRSTNLVAEDCSALYNKDAVAALVRKKKNLNYGKNKFKDIPDLANALTETYQKDHKDDKRQVLGSVSRELGLSIYLRKFGTEQGMRVMIMQTPLQSSLAVDKPTVFHIDGMHQKQHHDSNGQLYHLSISIWSERLDETLTVFRARVPNLTAAAHKLVVTCFLNNLKEDVKDFNVTNWFAKRGTGFVSDFSDAEISGTKSAVKEALILEQKVSKAKIDKILDIRFKGCDFHYKQNVNRLIKKSNLSKEETLRLKNMLSSAVDFKNREVAARMFEEVEKDVNFVTFYSVKSFLKWWKIRIPLLINPNIDVTTNNIAESNNALARIVIEDPNLSIEFKNSFEVDVLVFETLLARQAGVPTTWRLSNKQALLNRKKWKYSNDGVPNLTEVESEKSVGENNIMEINDEDYCEEIEVEDGDDVDIEDEDDIDVEEDEDEEGEEEEEEEEEEEDDDEYVEEEKVKKKPKVVEKKKATRRKKEKKNEVVGEEDEEDEEGKNKPKKSYWKRFDEDVNSLRSGSKKRNRDSMNYRRMDGEDSE